MGTARTAGRLGSALGAAVAGRLSERLGRLRVMHIAAAFFAVSSLGSSIPFAAWELGAWRFLGGVAIGLASVIGPTYIAEVAPAEYRGRLASFQQAAIVLGITASQLVNWGMGHSAGHGRAQRELPGRSRPPPLRARRKALLHDRRPGCANQLGHFCNPNRAQWLPHEERGEGKEPELLPNRGRRRTTRSTSPSGLYGICCPTIAPSNVSYYPDRRGGIRGWGNSLMVTTPIADIVAEHLTIWNSPAGEERSRSIAATYSGDVRIAGADAYAHFPLVAGVMITALGSEGPSRTRTRARCSARSTRRRCSAVPPPGTCSVTTAATHDCGAAPQP